MPWSLINTSQNAGWAGFDNDQQASWAVFNNAPQAVRAGISAVSVSEVAVSGTSSTAITWNLIVTE